LSPLHKIAPLLIVLIAFFLRVWQLDGVPPGWRDDELINSLVISQKVLDGDWAVYYADASGHEALYHVLNAGMLGLFGANVMGIRFLSVLLGTLAVPLTYVLGQRLFNRTTGLVAAAALSVSFWSLMYSRIGLRHVLAPLLALLAFWFFWKGMEGLGRYASRDWRLPNYPITQLPEAKRLNYVLSAVFISLGFYTYFASRGVPLILLAFCGYMALFVRGVLARQWRGWLVLAGVTAVLTLPLFITLQNQPASDARVAELAVPLVEARQGNFQPLAEYTGTTLGMFHVTGDDEFLYNIPDRPLFGLMGAVFFWMGVLLAIGFAIYDLQGRSRRAATFTIGRSRPMPLIPHPSPYAFLLLWWLAGISPGFISVPPASLGHTILAQPATYLLLALPFGILADWRLETREWISRRAPRPTPYALRLLPLLLLTTIAIRDLPDYFGTWPQRGMVRFLYRADYAALADYLNEREDLRDFGVTGLLAGPWDKVALAIDVHTAVSPRWYNPERVLLVHPNTVFYGFPYADPDFAAAYSPDDVIVGGYQLGQTNVLLNELEYTCFQNGLCASGSYAAERQVLAVTWWVKRPLSLPPMPLISNPPPPGVYAGPRLSVFAQLLDAEGQFLNGDDGLWIDPTTLHEGDIFIQLHHLPAPSVGDKIVFGLYDPMTGERILTADGRDFVEIQ
jgi:4-amino-4-deoxy-L-arabinose transferase-like glycosyltransferase